MYTGARVGFSPGGGGVSIIPDDIRDIPPSLRYYTAVLTLR